ncbi:BRCA1-associated RING domain protein 1 [Rhinophrynus dorsalis]
MLLRTRPETRGLDSGAGEDSESNMTGLPDLSRTRAALQEMEENLLCSKCMSLLKEPVCLGGCEHVFCRACVGESIGSECPTCHTPAWVQDVQINRQLDNMIQLCSKLRNLLDKGKQEENKMNLSQDTSLKLNTVQEKFKKKQIKMWFSPKSRKVRCIMEKGEMSQTNPPKNKPVSDLSYEFVSSSPDVKPVKKKSVSTRKTKKKKLQDINKEWGFDKQAEGNDLVAENQAQKSNRSVSFCSSPVIQRSPETVLETHDVGDQQDENNLDENLSKFNESTEEQSLAIHSTNLQDVSIESPKRARKRTPAKRRSHQLESSMSSASKRPRRKESSLPIEAHTEKISRAFSPVRASRTALKHCDQPEVAKDGNPVTGGMIMVLSNPKSPSLPKVKSPSTPSPHTRYRSKTGQKSTVLQTSPSNFTNERRNHKGETLLHVASIKGDLRGVEELLNGGANPNVKDNAGWTPLHEACNLGHTQVVELLLKHQALVNTTGYQNDTPLHDAVKNGHVAIVLLLRSHGASQDAVNIFGLRPVDYAETEEMKSALLQTQTNKEPISLHPCPVQGPFQRQEGAVVLTASGLSTSQRNDLSKLARTLKAELCSEYNNSVTHVIVSDDPVLRTMKCMKGTLAGCWILQFAWVKACLDSHGREPEELYEIDGGPQRARLNREQLLPNLLDGCHLYFLGCFKEHRKEELIELVKAAGGQILTRQPKPDSDVTQTINTVAYHADAESDQRFCTQYIVYDKSSKYLPEKVRQGKVWFAPSSWLIDCITCFTLLPVPQ